MYNNTLYQGEKHFCRYYLQAFSTEEVLKGYIKDSFKINGKQRIDCMFLSCHVRVSE